MPDEPEKQEPEKPAEATPAETNPAEDTSAENTPPKANPSDANAEETETTADNKKENKEPQKKDESNEANKSFAQEIEEINNKINALREKISNQRKQGKKPFFADILYRQANAKVHYAEVTRDPKDRQKIYELIKQAEEELNEEDQRDEKTFQDEIEELVEFEKMKLGDAKHPTETNKTDNEAQSMTPDTAKNKDKPINPAEGSADKDGSADNHTSADNGANEASEQKSDDGPDGNSVDGNSVDGNSVDGNSADDKEHERSDNTQDQEKDFQATNAKPDNDADTAGSTTNNQSKPTQQTASAQKI